jgi:hypothetical protein
MTVHPLRHSVVSPGMNPVLVSRWAFAPVGVGAVTESAQATVATITTAPTREKTRDLGDIVRSVKVKRCIYPAVS